MAKNITDVVAVVVDALSPLSSEERCRVVQASLTLLGEGRVKAADEPSSNLHVEPVAGQMPPRARSWMQQNSITEEQLENVFHIDGSNVEVIASSIPGSNNRERSRNAYLLMGVAQFLASGEAKFDDKMGRGICETFGFYDSTNHAKFFKAGNEFSGSREKGWVLTAPGLKAAARLVLQINELS